MRRGLDMDAIQSISDKELVGDLFHFIWRLVWRGLSFQVQDSKFVLSAQTVIIKSALSGYSDSGSLMEIVRTEPRIQLTG